MSVNNKMMYSKLVITNWNSNGIVRQRQVVIAFLERHAIDVLCVSETHLLPEQNFKLPGYNIYRKDRISQMASGGVAIIVKKSIKTSDFPILEVINIEVVGIVLELKNDRYLKIVSAYKQPNKRIISKDLEEVFNDNIPTLLIGDLNCKSTVWGCRASNPNGIRLYDVLSSHGIQISPPPEHTYMPYRNDHRSDILDIVLHKNISNPIYQSVLSELDSDHLPVLITIGYEPSINPKPLKIINGRVDWKIFRDFMQHKLSVPVTLSNSDEVDKAIDLLIQNIKNAVDHSTMVQSSRRLSNYMNPPQAIQYLIKEKHKTRRQWILSREPVVRKHLNYLIHRIQRELEQFRLTNYENYIKELEPKDPTLWRATKRILNQQHIIPTIKYDNNMYVTDLEKSEIFANYLGNTFTTPKVSLDISHSKQIKKDISTFLSSSVDGMVPVSPNEIKDIINKLSNNKAPGHDLITNIILKNLPVKVLVYLVQVFNACLRLGYFPIKWKIANVLLFHKPGKTKAEVSSYRPISLLPTISKVFEKVINRRLLDHVNSENIIPKFQFGFRSNHSTIHQLTRITEFIEKGFEEKKYTAAIFLDIKQAFDSVWHNGLLSKLIKIKTPNYLVHIIKSFLENRKFLTIVNSATSSIKPVQAGVPQGSIMGPLLFNIFVHDIPELEDTTLAMFADDTTLLTQNSDLNITISQLQDSLNIITKWFSKWKLQLNTLKSEAKIFTLRRISDPKMLKINGKDIQWNREDSAIKYLGVYLDKRLKWGYHINKKINEAHVRLIQLYPLLNKKSSLKAECGKLLYTSILRPIFIYGSPVWSNACHTQINKLQTFQNKVLRIVLNAPWFIRNSLIQRELDILPIKEFIRKIYKSYHVKLKVCPGSSHYKLGKRNIHRRLKRRLPQDILLSGSEVSDSD